MSSRFFVDHHTKLTSRNLKEQGSRQLTLTNTSAVNNCDLYKETNNWLKHSPSSISRLAVSNWLTRLVRYLKQNKTCCKCSQDLLNTNNIYFTRDQNLNWGRWNKPTTQWMQNQDSKIIKMAWGYSKIHPAAYLGPLMSFTAFVAVSMSLDSMKLATRFSCTNENIIRQALQLYICKMSRLQLLEENHKS